MPGPNYLNSITKYHRVYSGINSNSKKFAKKFLSSFIDVKNYPLTELHSTTASEMTKVLENSYRVLKDGGIMYMSFKYGEGEVQRGGRHFSNYTEDTFFRLLDSLDIFKVEKIWKTSDVRPDRTDEFWLNVIVKKKVA